MYTFCDTIISLEANTGLNIALRILLDGVRRVALTVHAEDTVLGIPSSALHPFLHHIEMRFHGKFDAHGTCLFAVDADWFKNVRTLIVQHAVMKLIMPKNMSPVKFLPRLKKVELLLTDGDIQAVLDLGVSAKLQVADLMV